MANRKKLMKKKNELKEFRFDKSLFLSNSMCTENRTLFYKCCQLKNAKRIVACLLFSDIMNV